jgi:hypothetical protein
VGAADPLQWSGEREILPREQTMREVVGQADQRLGRPAVAAPPGRGHRYSTTQTSGPIVLVTVDVDPVHTGSATDQLVQQLGPSEYAGIG